jgi:signal transduction histidine kinase
MPEGGRLRLAVRLDLQCVLVEVEDNGAGIPEEMQSRIFEPFFTTKPVGQGTGLGLYLCHQIVESLGGTIAVESREGEGTTVRVQLPCAPPEAGS